MEVNSPNFLLNDRFINLFIIKTFKYTLLVKIKLSFPFIVRLFPYPVSLYEWCIYKFSSHTPTVPDLQIKEIFKNTSSGLEVSDFYPGNHPLIQNSHLGCISLTREYSFSAFPRTKERDKRWYTVMSLFYR